MDEDDEAQTAESLGLVFSAGVELFCGPALLWFYTAACSLVLPTAIADQQRRLY